MSACRECTTKLASLAFARGDLSAARRLLAKHANRADAPHFIEQAKVRKAEVKEAQRRLDEHRADCEIARQPREPRPIKGVRRTPQPKPEKQPLKVIDRAALDAALADLDQQAEQAGGRITLLAERRPSDGRSPDEPSRLDAGGGCQTCGKWVPGERRYCGRCMAKRRI